jgi:hypothetical protein
MNKLTPSYDKPAEGVWPNQPQQLLLQAALLDAPVAPLAWAKWQELVSLDSIDPASWKLIPLVYVNLKRLKVSDPLLRQAREVHFYHWRCNQLLFQQAGDFLDLMKDLDIPVLILKGIALANLYYPDTGSRPMADLDVLVPIEQFLPVCEYLTKAGWKATLRELDDFALEKEPSFGAARADGLNVDIHGHVLHANCTKGADAEFWAHAQPFALKERKALTLAPEDHLLHVISHGVRWCAVPPFRWVADAWWILARRGGSFDWERFVRQTQFHEANLEIFHGLKLMDNLMPMKFPSGLLSRLEAIPSSGEVYVQFALNTASVPVSGLPRALAIWRGSGRAAPVYRLDGQSPQIHDAFLSLSDVRRIIALLNYAGKALVRITVRLFRQFCSQSGRAPAAGGSSFGSND